MPETYNGPFALERERTIAETLLDEATINASRAAGVKRVLPSATVDLTPYQSRIYMGRAEKTGIEIGGRRYDPKAVIAGILNGLCSTDGNVGLEELTRVSFRCDTNLTQEAGARGSDMPKFIVTPEQATEIFLQSGKTLGMNQADLLALCDQYAARAGFSQWPPMLEARRFLPNLGLRLKDRTGEAVVQGAAKAEQEAAALRREVAGAKVDRGAAKAEQEIAALRREVIETKNEALRLEHELERQRRRYGELEAALALEKRAHERYRKVVEGLNPNSFRVGSEGLTSDKPPLVGLLQGNEGVAKELLEALSRGYKITLARINAGSDEKLKEVSRQCYEAQIAEIREAARTLNIFIRGINM